MTFKWQLPVVVVAASIIATASLAQGGPKVSPVDRLKAAIAGLQTACRGEVEKYCTTVTPGEGRLFYCLLAHEDKVSLACDHAIYRSISDVTWLIDRLEELAETCAADIEKLCPTAEPGQGEIAACLRKNSKTTSSACSAALERFSSQ